MHAFLNAAPKTANQLCGKVPYPSRRDAMRSLKKHGPPRGPTATGKGIMNAYRCGACGQYHLGHK